MPTSEINVVPFRDDLTRRARKVPKLESQAITLAGRRRRCNHVVARLKGLGADRSHRRGRAQWRVRKA